MQVLIVAAENGAIPGMKVGGVADVVRDIPIALTELGHTVDVIVPAYGYADQLEGTNRLASFVVPFGGQQQEVSLYELTLPNQPTGLRQFVLKHSLFAAAGKGKVYCDDPADRPFATDATKYALFCVAVAECLQQQLIGKPDVLHLHDWHAAMLAVLRAYNPLYEQLKQIHTVYTIHNLAMQGTRPLRGDSSSFEHWYPYLSYDGEVICDPQARHCINPMRAAINLVDKVHVVSPSYAAEVLQPSRHQQGFFAGEGLEQDLQQAQQQQRLVGILNGCEYPEKSTALTITKLTLANLYHDAEAAVIKWMGNYQSVRTVDYIALRRLGQWQSLHKQQAKSGVLITSIGRLTDQKVLLLRQSYHGKTVLAALLELLATHNARLLILGSGDAAIEQEFMRAAANYDNLLFLNGYAENLSDQIYQLGDLFLMPSSFEPCGISQMLAMRSGQPCIVHAVGGLKDTVIDGKNGFSFGGEDLVQQSDGLLSGIGKALELHASNPTRWQAITKAAMESRFSLKYAATQYVERLYQP